MRMAPQNVFVPGQVGNHEQSVQSEHHDRKQCAEGRLLEEHCPEQRIGGDHHLRAQRERRQDVGEEQHPGHELHGQRHV